jgi:SAM-dependent methyltransferase
MADFDAYGERYQEALRDATAFSGQDPELFTQIKADLVVEVARRRIGEPESLRALDVGCGPGNTDRFLEDTFRELHGVDVSERMVEQATAANPWASYRQYQAGDPIPHADDEFDLTFTICVVHHVPPEAWPGFIAEMARVTRPGGIAAVFEHNAANPGTRRVLRDCEFDDDAVPLKRRQVRTLLRDAGLEIVESPYIVFFPFASRLARRVERLLGPVPLGAQYYVAARKPG